jgi:peptidyl-prolyl cis-trans isomerase C
MGPKMLRGLASLLLAALVAGGCGKKADDPVVVRMKGKEITLSQIRSEFDRVKGPGAYDAAPFGQRLDFARTLADKEVLLSEARRLVKEPSKLRRVQLARYRERFLIGAFWEHILKGRTVPPESIAAFRKPYLEERLVSHILLPEEEKARDVLRRLEAGESFETLARELSWDVESREQGGRLGWINYLDFPYARLAKVVFLKMEKGQIYPEPVRTVRGYHVVRVDDIRPRELTPEEEARVERMARQSFNRNLTSSIRDSLLAAHGVEIRDEALEPLTELFRAFWDSLNTLQSETGAVEYRSLDPPSAEALGPEVASTVLVTMKDGDWTVADFLESLKECDLEFWPSLNQTVEQTRFQVRRRMIRWLMYQQAIKWGLEDSDYYRQRMRLREERLLLEDYYQQVLAPQVPVTEEEMRRYYETHPEDFMKDDRIDLGFLLFPPDLRERAEEVARALRAGQSWEEVGQAEASGHEGVVFVPATGLQSGDAYREITQLAKRLVDTGQLGLNTFSDPVETSQGWVILRVTSRVKGTPLRWEIAKRFIKVLLTDRGVERLLAKKMPELRQQYAVEVFEEPLKQGSPSA